MSRRIRSFATAIAIAAVIVASASPALAFRGDAGLEAREAHTPVLIDILFMRPMGLMLLVGGTVAMAPTAAIVTITRPTDMGKPFSLLMAKPFRYTFLDPIGSHPDHESR